MKTMEAYTRELYGRIEERKKDLAKRRRLLTGILASAAVFVAAAAVTVPLLGKPPRASVTQTETIGGKTFTLAVDSHDRYVGGNASYVYAENPAEQAEDRALFSGLFCFRTGEGLCFAFREDGATYLDLDPKPDFKIYPDEDCIKAVEAVQREGLEGLQEE